MKHEKLGLSALILIILAVVAVLQPNTYAQDLQNFSFDSFSANYYLSRATDGGSRLEVKEELVARFPNTDQNHGILRALPETYQNHSLRLNVISVTDHAGKPYPYTTYGQNDNLVLKIGDGEKYVHGQVTYRIHYMLSDVINFLSSHDEFFWDVNGDQWPQPFGSVDVKIHIPAELARFMIDDQVCHTGFFGQVQNCVISRHTTENRAVIAATAKNISAYQTLSIALQFKKGTFTKSQALIRDEMLKKVSYTVGTTTAVIVPLGAFIFMYRRWRQFGDDPKSRGVIVPHYEQPKGLDALTSDYLYKQALRPQAISALLIELAVGGYIDIREIAKKGLFGSKDYELTLKKLPEHTPHLVNKAIKVVFENTEQGTKVKMSDLKKDSYRRKETYDRMKKLEDALADNLHTRGYFIKNPKSVKSGYKIWGMVFAAIGGLAIWAAAAIGTWIIGGLGAGLIAGAIVVYIFAHLMPARTLKGVEDYDSLLGLKDYIKTAEADRLKYLQSPEGAEKIADKEAFNPHTNLARIKLFENLLPYAMLFGLEKQWAKQFEGIYTSPPDWYSGNWSAFNAGYLGASLSDFSGASVPAFTSPSSSGSGFSGGGAGGGGGGGGGGGW